METLKSQLILAEIRNGVKQVNLPTNRSVVKAEPPKKNRQLPQRSNQGSNRHLLLVTNQLRNLRNPTKRRRKIKRNLQLKGSQKPRKVRMSLWVRRS